MTVAAGDSEIDRKPLELPIAVTHRVASARLVLGLVLEQGFGRWNGVVRPAFGRLYMRGAFRRARRTAHHRFAIVGHDRRNIGLDMSAANQKSDRPHG